MLSCQKCQESTTISRNDLSDGVVVSECCYAPVLLNGHVWQIWDYEEEQRVCHAEYLMDMRREQALLDDFEEVA